MLRFQSVNRGSSYLCLIDEEIGLVDLDKVLYEISCQAIDIFIEAIFDLLVVKDLVFDALNSFTSSLPNEGILNGLSVQVVEHSLDLVTQTYAFLFHYLSKRALHPLLAEL